MLQYVPNDHSTFIKFKEKLFNNLEIETEMILVVIRSLGIENCKKKIPSLHPRKHQNPHTIDNHALQVGSHNVAINQLEHLHHHQDPVIMDINNQQ